MKSSCFFIVVLCCFPVNAQQLLHTYTFTLPQVKPESRQSAAIELMMGDIVEFSASCPQNTIIGRRFEWRAQGTMTRQYTRGKDEYIERWTESRWGPTKTPAIFMHDFFPQFAVVFPYESNNNVNVSVKQSGTHYYVAPANGDIQIGDLFISPNILLADIEQKIDDHLTVNEKEAMANGVRELRNMGCDGVSSASLKLGRTETATVTLTIKITRAE